MPLKELIVKEKNEGDRLDVTMASFLAGHFSRSKVKKMIEDGFITVEGKRVSAHYHVKCLDWQHRIAMLCTLMQK